MGCAFWTSNDVCTLTYSSEHKILISRRKKKAILCLGRSIVGENRICCLSSERWNDTAPRKGNARPSRATFSCLQCAPWLCQLLQTQYLVLKSIAEAGLRSSPSCEGSFSLSGNRTEFDCRTCDVGKFAECVLIARDSLVCGIVDTQPHDKQSLTETPFSVGLFLRTEDETTHIGMAGTSYDLMFQKFCPFGFGGCLPVC